MHSTALKTIILGSVLFMDGGLWPDKDVGIYWDDLTFPTANLTAVANAPTLAQFADDGAGSIGVFSQQFADAGSPNEKRVSFQIQIPHGAKLDGELRFHAHVSPEDTTVCNYRHCLEYYSAAPTGTFPANTTTICTTFASSAVALTHQIAAIGTVSMVGMGTSEVIIATYYRNSDNAADTCNSKLLWVHDIDAHYQIDAPGSRQEYIK